MPLATSTIYSWSLSTALTRRTAPTKPSLSGAWSRAPCITSPLFQKWTVSGGFPTSLRSTHVSVLGRPLKGSISLTFTWRVGSRHWLRGHCFWASGQMWSSVSWNYQQGFCSSHGALVLSLVDLELSLEAESDPISMGSIPVPFIPWEFRWGEGLPVIGVGRCCSDEELCMQQWGRHFAHSKCMVEMVVYNIVLTYIFLSLIRFQKQIGNYILKISDTCEVSTEAWKSLFFLRYNLYNYFLNVFWRSLPSFGLADIRFIHSFPKGARLFLHALDKRVLEFKLMHAFFFFFFLNQGPSNVSDIEISTNTTSATFSWQNSDEASLTYSYRLLIEKDGNSSDATEIVTGTGITNAIVTELTPGSQYTVTIFTLVGDVIESLPPGWQSFCTGE